MFVYASLLWGGGDVKEKASIIWRDSSFWLFFASAAALPSQTLLWCAVISFFAHNPPYAVYDGSLHPTQQQLYTWRCKQHCSVALPRALILLALKYTYCYFLVKYWYCCIVDARRRELECCRRGVCTAATGFIRPCSSLPISYLYTVI